MAMHDVIVRLAPGIEGLIFDLFTSRREITDLGFPASRFPYYLGTSVVTLCGELNMSRLGQWALKADFYFGSGRVKFGRSKGSSTSYKPFDLTVGGVAIPHLSADDRKKINGKADLHTIQANYEATCSCSTVTQDQAQALAIGFTVLGEGYEAYQKDSKTYQISMGMASSSKDYNKMALFMVAELVLKDVQKSPLEKPIVHYLECTRKFVDKENSIFLSMDKGDNLIFVEPPFVTTCYSLAEGWVYDAPLPEDPARIEGMYMSWAMKYSITLDQQIKVTGFGLVFNQFCTDKSRLSKGPYLAHIFKQLLAKLGEKQLDGLNSFVEQADGHSSPFEPKTR